MGAAKTKDIQKTIVLPKRVPLQPDPPYVLGGDCGACVLAGLLDHSVDEVYSDIKGDLCPFSRSDMLDALWTAYERGELDRLVPHVPIWPDYRQVHTFGFPSWDMSEQWYQYVKMGIDGGYYGVAFVVYDQQGAYVDGDHWVLLCGTREKAETPEILVSCSSPDTPNEEWVTVTEFLKRRGGYPVIMARPSSK